MSIKDRRRLMYDGGGLGGGMYEYERKEGRRFEYEGED
jgi:hypothetical protein